MLTIDEPTVKNNFPFSNLGFRPFFFAAGFFSSLLMLLWLFIFNNTLLLKQTIIPQIWHAHEMIFAYAMAVIVGFLLTAVKNWTNIQTLHGKPLMLLFGLWLIARLLPFIEVSLPIQAIIDTSFLLLASIFIAMPIIKAQSWSNIGIVSKIILMAVAHIVYYLGLLGIIEEGVRWGLYGAFYLIIALIFVMARRVLPFFIEKSLKLSAPLNNYLWLDRSSLMLFVLYLVFEVFWPSDLIYIVAFSLLILHGIRLVQWHKIQLWSHPLLWSLYLAYFALSFAFALKIASYFFAISPYMSIHSFAFGIGFITLGMMSRVTLGHTGRDINQYPKAIPFAFALLAIGFIFRVILPLFNSEFYTLWILIAQITWLSAFALFIASFAPMFFQKRVDQKFG